MLTYVTDMNRDASQVWVFEAGEITRGPVAKIGLPRRICVGTHACWASAAELARRND